MGNNERNASFIAEVSKITQQICNNRLLTISKNSLNIASVNREAGLHP